MLSIAATHREWLPLTENGCHSQRIAATHGQWLPLVQWGDGDRAAWLQSWLICLEMFLAALAHAYAFPPRDYIDPACQHVGNFAHNVKVMFDVRVSPGFASS